MALPTNILQQVQTYQRSELALLQNYGCFVSTSNTKFKDFHNLVANLGDTVTFDLPPRYTTRDGLVATFQDSVQRVQPLTVNRGKNTATAFSAQQFIFNSEKYMEVFGRSAVAELSTAVESDIADLARTAPYRFFGDGLTQLSSYTQLASMLALYKTYGVARDKIKVYLSDIAVPQIVGSGHNQFVLDRNEESAMSWMVGNWSGVEFYESNLLPIHESGTAGESGAILTVVSTNDPSGANITQITVSGAAISDPDAIKENDSLQFQDGVSGQPNQRYLTFIGHKPSSAPVQVRATADAASDGAGNVTISIDPPLSITVGNADQNITHNVVAGMQLKALPSHRCGLIVGGNALFLAMPQLPSEDPFPTGNESDPDTGVSLRMYYGSKFGENERGLVHDVIWGRTLPGEYSMKIVFPL